jgi:ribosomal protein S18 acetylase RimI-like enzyme
VQLRPYRPDDEASVLALWRETKLAAYPYLEAEQAYTAEDDAAFFRENLEPLCDIWLAVAPARTGAPTGDEQILGFLALIGSYLDRLYVRPGCQRRGVGHLLLEKAKALSPEGLELHTHQQNLSGCSFYERNGFRAFRYGTSAPPESAPDVEYRWRPGKPG